MNKVIEINKLSKRFSIRVKQPTLFNLCQRFFPSRSDKMEFWALRDLSIRIDSGDRVGIIGSNGSGKTTLLRLIAGLYKATAGEIRRRGSIAAFLQMGIGMERYLTVLENIYLFSAIMGIDRRETKRKLDDILSFAEMAQFINCPLCDLSTGMVERLAFSIARHVDSDIILLDEMLAAGDIGFRNKCYNFLEDYLNTSKTVIMTSHETEMIKRICNKCLWLEKGRLKAYGPSEDILNAYIFSKSLNPTAVLHDKSKNNN